MNEYPKDRHWFTDKELDEDTTGYLNMDCTTIRCWFCYPDNKCQNYVNKLDYNNGCSKCGGTGRLWVGVGY